MKWGGGVAAVVLLVVSDLLRPDLRLDLKRGAVRAELP